MVEPSEEPGPEDADGTYATPHGAGSLSHEASYEGPATRPGLVTALATVFALATVAIFIAAIATFLGYGAAGGNLTWGLGLFLLTGALGGITFGLYDGQPWGWYVTAGFAAILLIASAGALMSGEILLGLGLLVIAALLGLILAMPTVRHWYEIGEAGIYERTT